MEKVIVAFADVKSEAFKPVFAEFPVAKSTVEAYIKEDDRSLINAAKVMLGLDNETHRVAGVFWDSLVGKPITVDQFFDGLRDHWGEVHKKCYQLPKMPNGGPRVVVAADLLSALQSI